MAKAGKEAQGTSSKFETKLSLQVKESFSLRRGEKKKSSEGPVVAFQPSLENMNNQVSTSH